MMLDEFKVGDKVVGCGSVDSVWYEIMFIGSSYVVLCSCYGVERIEGAGSTDYTSYHPEPTYNELKAENLRLRKIGLDLYTSIRDAAWDNYLSGPTPHMKSAAENWKAEVEDHV